MILHNSLQRCITPLPGLMIAVAAIAVAAIAVAAIAVAATAPSASAQNRVRVSELTGLDRQYMAQQRAIMDDLAGTNLGHRFSGDKKADLRLLQLLLDKRLVRSDQTRELQAMGVIMGDLLAAELDLHWVIYEDSVGRSRALRYRQSDEYLFPVTMISRRREAGSMTPVEAIYQKAYDIMAPLRTPLPFQ